LQERIDKEIALLRTRYPHLEYRADGRWVRIPAYRLPKGWRPRTTDVAFQIPATYPGGPPYGIYVLSGIRFGGDLPANYTEPATTQPPFGGSWGIFSWSTADGQWRATAEPDPVRGYSLLSWVNGFADRFSEGK
jgi:hypothetical protein